MDLNVHSLIEYHKSKKNFKSKFHCLHYISQEQLFTIDRSKTNSLRLKTMIKFRSMVFSAAWRGLKFRVEVYWISNRCITCMIYVHVSFERASKVNLHCRNTTRINNRHVIRLTLLFHSEKNQSFLTSTMTQRTCRSISRTTGNK